MNSEVKKAVEVLKKGGIIIFPTDTAFGIGCRIDNIEAVERLFAIRKRPSSQAMPVLVSSFEMARAYAKEITPVVLERLIYPYWPGALTVVVQSNTYNVPESVRGGGETIGLRMPNHKSILAIIKDLGVPILGPSANIHGQATPFEVKDLNQKLIKLVDFVLEGECDLKKSSTVIDTTKVPWKILRAGALDITID
jgi:L-threonylcarbamoyladenylate synthase